MARWMEERGGVEERHCWGEVDGGPEPGRLDFKATHVENWVRSRNAVKTVTGRVMLNPVWTCALRPSIRPARTILDAPGHRRPHSYIKCGY